MSLSLARQVIRSQSLGRPFVKYAALTPTILRTCAHYNTATAAKEETSKEPNQQLKPIIFPNVGTESFNVAARILPSNLAEQFAILKACISSGLMVRAARIMLELYKSKPDEMKVFVDINIYNSFLNGFASVPKPMTKECLDWFDKMKTYGVTADANTYAIILKGFLKKNSFHTARAILSEMKINENLSIEDMLSSSYLNKEDIVLFRKLVSESQGSNSVDIQKLLSELEIATNKRLGDTAEVTMENATKSGTVSAELMEDIPEVRPTRSVGVQFLQEQLSALRDPNTSAKMDPYELQLSLEYQGYEMALQRLLYTKEQSIERGDTLNAMNLTPLKKIMWNWHENLVPLIEEEIIRCEAATTRETERKSYGPFLKLLPTETLSIVTILELLRLHNSSGIGDGMKTARAVIDVGKAVEMEYNAMQMKKRSNSNLMAKRHDVHTLFSSGKLFNMALRSAQIEAEKKSGDLAMDPNLNDWNPVWPSSIRAKVGSVLTSLLLEAAKIPVPSRDPETGLKIIENIPAFFHTYQYVHGKRVGIIKYSEQLTEMISREPIRDTLHPRLLPMLVHPRPWLSFNSGGYLSTKSLCMRIKDSPEQLLYLQKASEQDRLAKVLAGLDVLGSTRWRVNKDVFKVILEVWNSGEKFADIPPLVEGHAPLPPKPANYETDPKAKFNWVSEVKQLQTNEKNNHSLRCDVNYKVETARAFLNLPMFFPHNMDFRGRAYPMPPTLNHLGNDLCRGLLHFEEAKPLGERGWKWLKIHLANLYGFDKHSFSEREVFTENHLEDVFDSVDNPLTGNKWWVKADSPWQCLAACYEVASAVRSGNPEEFKSHLPIHQDGTCNGLQHYAALGGDLAGARAVNLMTGDKPADVYTGVADMVNEQINKQAAAGDEYAQLLKGNVSRKVVKQTVMTNVYGVTFVGARAQIENRLKEIPDLPKNKVYALSGYLAKAVFASLGEMFHGAHKIQDWLTDSARRISKSVPLETLQENGLVPGGPSKSETTLNDKPKRGKKKKLTFSARNPSANQMSSVIWTTPLGLPIVQPYRRSGKKQVATLLQTIFIEDPDASRPVNSLKQSTAFPPNFIHSLDATHMLMSAVACHKKGMTFASVHDSYWTHACDVDSMNEVIRDQFIELHSQPIMENLLNEFKERYKNFRVPVSTPIDPKTGDFQDIDPFALADSSSLFENDAENEKRTKEEEQKNAIKAIFGLGADEAEEDEEIIDEVEGEEKPKKLASSNTSKFKYTWEPLTFMPLPEKGEFDINEVKKSPYFFH
ncbi:hypothetical protein BDB01DRAFT_906773 [Pilobolus umbonatus]|nr:hypothetical protein BDB01DRAFT_906773 [Pilobolus umbonatus]